MTTICLSPRRLPTCAALAILSVSSSLAWSSANPQSRSFQRDLSRASMSSLTVAQFPCLSDNYGYLIHDEASGCTAAIDTPCASTYRKELLKRGWKLTHILNTHHHYDHTGGNVDLKELGNDIKVLGPDREKNKIPGLDTPVSGVNASNSCFVAMLFSPWVVEGCLRTPDQFWTSLKRLRNLPDETTVYCAHEYTESNARFALTVEPGNAELAERVQHVHDQRARGSHCPNQDRFEKRTNPFYAWTRVMRSDLESVFCQEIQMPRPLRRYD
ncbi:Hydroxyacylglutathione hydrolase C-terminus [Fragilaria crotonensis]|nr:Hydroxyacylglutathione hydrolase C-terminus [Fragilaria crotonensis]